LPLARHGLRVHGIELSEAMVARLRETGCRAGWRDSRRLRHNYRRG
jgi:hypothetical protein